MTPNAISDPLLSLLLTGEVRQEQKIVQLRQTFGTDHNRHAVIDNVFQPQLLSLLRQVVHSDGNFSDNLKLKSAAKAGKRVAEDAPRGEVTANDFNAAADSDRFIKQRKLVGARPGREGSPAMKAEALVRRAMGSSGFLGWLSAVSGMSLERTGGINLKLHGPGHFLRKHSDTRKGRKLCMVHYLHENWEESFAGRFLLHRADGPVKAIDPVPNRMLLFDVTQDNFHEIESLGAVPEGWLRINYSAWFG